MTEQESPPCSIKQAHTIWIGGWRGFFGYFASYDDIPVEFLGPDSPSPPEAILMVIQRDLGDFLEDANRLWRAEMAMLNGDESAEPMVHRGRLYRRGYMVRRLRKKESNDG